MQWKTKNCLFIHLIHAILPRYEIWTATESDMSSGDTPADDLSTDAADYRTKVSNLRWKDFNHLDRLLMAQRLMVLNLEREMGSLLVLVVISSDLSMVIIWEESISENISFRECLFHPANQRQGWPLYFQHDGPGKQEKYQIPSEQAGQTKLHAWGLDGDHPSWKGT